MEKEQKIAIVTGGSSGLGYAICKKFTENGIFTFVIGRDKEKLEKACADFGANAEAVVFDLTDLPRIPQVIEELAKRKTRIDYLVNNAGVNLKKCMLDVSDDEFQNVLLTNTQSVFSMSREVAKVMARNKSGAIINISSMAAHYGIPLVIAYTASKTAIEGMTRAMAVELSSYGIRVNCIAPGFIQTQMSDTALNNDPDRKQRVLSRTPLAKLGSAEDVANAAYYLASSEASFVTGVVLPIDGGNSIGF